MAGQKTVEIKDKLNLTIEEAAAYSNISSTTLRRLIKEGDPGFTIKIGTKTLIKRRMFERFIEGTDAL